VATVLLCVDISLAYNYPLDMVSLFYHIKGAFVYCPFLTDLFIHKGGFLFVLFVHFSDSGFKIILCQQTGTARVFPRRMFLLFFLIVSFALCVERTFLAFRCSRRTYLASEKHEAVAKIALLGRLYQRREYPLDLQGVFKLRRVKT